MFGLAEVCKCKYRNASGTFPGVMSPFFRKALEDLAIPCFLGGMARGMLGKSSPIHIRQNRRDALKEADLVLLAGNTFRYRFVRNGNFKTHRNILAKKSIVLRKTKKLHLH